MEPVKFHKVAKNKIRFRKARMTDLPFLLKLRIDTMEEHLQNQGLEWSLEQHQARILDKFDQAEIILYGEEEIGFLKLIEDQHGFEIQQIQIHKTHQGKGIGSAVLNMLIEKARVENKLLRLSVLKHNKARLLYERVGFVEVDEDENSVFMEKKGA